jgi:hypothetical protein
LWHVLPSCLNEDQGVWQMNLLMEARGFSSAPDPVTYIVPLYPLVKRQTERIWNASQALRASQLLNYNY